jgi:hypothetical protein
MNRRRLAEPGVVEQPKTISLGVQLIVEWVGPTQNCAMLRCTMTADRQDDPATVGPAPANHVDDGRRPAPPHVYRAAGGDHWIVEPPQNTVSGESAMVFTGSRAQHHALTYAHERFGSARFFPY